MSHGSKKKVCDGVYLHLMSKATLDATDMNGCYGYDWILWMLWIWMDAVDMIGCYSGMIVQSCLMGEKFERFLPFFMFSESP